MAFRRRSGGRARRGTKEQLHWSRACAEGNVNVTASPICEDVPIGFGLVLADANAFNPFASGVDQRITIRRLHYPTNVWITESHSANIAQAFVVQYAVVKAQGEVITLLSDHAWSELWDLDVMDQGNLLFTSAQGGVAHGGAGTQVGYYSGPGLGMRCDLKAQRILDSGEQIALVFGLFCEEETETATMNFHTLISVLWQNTRR